MTKENSEQLGFSIPKLLWAILAALLKLLARETSNGHFDQGGELRKTEEVISNSFDSQEDSISCTLLSWRVNDQLNARTSKKLNKVNLFKDENLFNLVKRLQAKWVISEGCLHEGTEFDLTTFSKSLVNILYGNAFYHYFDKRPYCDANSVILEIERRGDLRPNDIITLYLFNGHIDLNKRCGSGIVKEIIIKVSEGTYTTGSQFIVDLEEDKQSKHLQRLDRANSLLDSIKDNTSSIKQMEFDI